MKRWSMLCAVLIFPMVSLADNPVDVLEAQSYDKSACIEKQAEECVNVRCTSGPYSEDIDCPNKCQQEAQAQCEVSS